VEIKAERILYEDNHLIIINKQPSEIVQGDKTGDNPLSEIIKAYLKEKYHKPGKVYLGVVHRLDRPVSGAIIFARTEKALGRLNKMLREHEISKIYWAIVKNKPPSPEGHLVHYLKKNEERNKSTAYSKETNGTQTAELKYITLATSNSYSLLEVELFSGRHHQIRAQLAAIGCPIKGDVKYGFKRTNPNASIHLHARKLQFIHPVSGKEICIFAPPPEDALWNTFLSIISEEF
jgi:23S rRNA pseudouridine1911/1915/1917 synthase